MKSLTIEQMESVDCGTTYRQAYCASTLLLTLGLGALSVACPAAAIAAYVVIGVMGTWFTMCA